MVIIVFNYRLVFSLANERSIWSWSSNGGAALSFFIIQSNCTPWSRPHSDSASSIPERSTRIIEGFTQNPIALNNIMSPCTSKCIPGVNSQPLSLLVSSEASTRTQRDWLGYSRQNHCRSDRRRVSLTTCKVHSSVAEDWQAHVSALLRLVCRLLFKPRSYLYIFQRLFLKWGAVLLKHYRKGGHT